MNGWEPAHGSVHTARLCASGLLPVNESEDHERAEDLFAASARRSAD